MVCQVRHWIYKSKTSMLLLTNLYSSRRFRNKYFKLQISNYIVIHFMNVIKEVSLILSHNMEKEHPFEIGYQLVRDHARWKGIKMRWSQSQVGEGKVFQTKGSKCAKFLKWGSKRGPERPDQSDIMGEVQRKW